MKKVIIIFSALILSISAYSQTNNSKSIENAKLYCVKMQNGALVVIYQGNPITSDILLDNAFTLKPNGIVIRKDGSQTTLKEGECLAQDGTMPAMKEN